LLRSIKELIAAQLVVEESEERFAFRHALTREATYSSLLARERRQLHRAAAETLEHLYANSVDDHLGDLAYHFYEAGVWEKALEYGQRAGERAQGLTRCKALDHFNHASGGRRNGDQGADTLSRPRTGV
jgi:predicted ATPase